MADLLPEYTSKFERDIKRLSRKNYPMEELKSTVKLILRNDSASKEELLRHNRKHRLRGIWKGAYECHVANLGDWLLVWQTTATHAIFLRTGSHDDIF